MGEKPSPSAFLNRFVARRIATERGELRLFQLLSVVFLVPTFVPAAYLRNSVGFAISFVLAFLVALVIQKAVWNIRCRRCGARVFYEGPVIAPFSLFRQTCPSCGRDLRKPRSRVAKTVGPTCG